MIVILQAIQSTDGIFEPIPRTIDEPDLVSLVKRVMVGPYTIDPAFSSFISHPSAYYTDLYGIHALKDFTAEKIIKDFTLTDANVIFQNNTMIQLKFHSGWNATFHPYSSLVIKYVSLPIDHVYIGGDNAQELIQNLIEFHEILKRNNLESTYLIPNPCYDMEKQVDRAFYSGKSTVNVTVDPTMKYFQAASNAVMIYPDPVHGDLPWYMQFMTALRTASIDWLGMEMLTSAIQTILDSFCTAPDGSTEYLNARHNLTTYFLHAWTPYFKLNITSGEDSPYFKAVDLIRQKKGRVYGLDLDNMDFLIFRYGESAFGAAVRSLNWANSIPIKGRGIVFGGSAHFTSTKPINMQDFLMTRDNSIKLFSIRPL
jgi:hypothetical protein